MARPKRHTPFNTFLHLFTKFIPELELKTKKLAGIKKLIIISKKRFKIHISNYYIHNNHLHLEVYVDRKSNTSVSKYMQWLLTCMAIYTNRALKRHGKVFYDRFKSKIINTYRYFENLARYITNNSAKHADIKPSDWPYSSYHYYVRGIPDPIITHYQDLFDMAP